MAVVIATAAVSIFIVVVGLLLLEDIRLRVLTEAAACVLRG